MLGTRVVARTWVGLAVGALLAGGGCGGGLDGYRPVVTFPDPSTFAPPESYEIAFAVERATFRLGPAESQREEPISFEASGAFKLRFDACEPGVACVSVVSLRERFSGVELPLGGERLKVEPFELTTEHLDLERSKGRYDYATKALTLELSFREPFSFLPEAVRPAEPVVFRETGVFDLQTGIWRIKGSTVIALAGGLLAMNADDKEAEGHPDGDLILGGMRYLLDQMSLDIDVFAKAKACACRPTCLLAADQLIGSAFVERALGAVAEAVVDGALSGFKPTSKLGKTLKKLMKEAVDQDGPVLGSDPDEPQQVEITTKRGIKIDKTCAVEWAITYNPATRQVVGAFSCDCKGKKCAVSVTYTAQANGMPANSPRPKVEYD